MKRNLFVLIFPLLGGLFCSCISFKISSILPPENQVEFVYMCKKVDDSGTLLKPLDIQSEYTLEDESIICFVRLKDVSQEIHLRWKWYSADKQMARDTGKVMINQDKKYLEVVTAYDRFRLNPMDKEKIEGQWTAVVFLNDKLIGRKIFQVSKVN